MALGGETPFGVRDYPKVGRPELRRISSCPSCRDNHPGDVSTQGARSVTAKRHNATFTCELCLLMRAYGMLRRFLWAAAAEVSAFAAAAGPSRCAKPVFSGLTDADR
jgi:hypothetical protein